MGQREHRKEQEADMAKEIWKPGNMLYPLPAVMVSCGDREGRTNIITVAWTGTVCTNPAMVYILSLIHICLEIGVAEGLNNVTV